MPVVLDGRTPVKRRRRSEKPVQRPALCYGVDVTKRAEELANDDDNDALESNARTALRVFGQGVASVGRSIAGAYRAIDPDLRRHAYQLPLLGLMLLAPQARTIEPLDDDGDRPLVFIHGLGGRPGNFLGLKTYFASRGRTRSYVVDFGNAASIEVMAEHLASVIDEIIRCNDLADGATIDLVAHSMGGLVGRLLLDEERYRERVANLVTLGTPHRGSHLARLAATRSVLDLRPGSAVLQTLDEQNFWGEEDTPDLTAFWSRSDTVVLPAESARFEQGQSIEIVGSTHYGYLIDPEVWREVWTVLRS